VNTRNGTKKAGRNQNSAPLDQFSALTGYKWKYAVHVLRDGTAKQNAIRKRRPANRTGKRFDMDDVIKHLRLIQAFFHWKYEKLLAPLMRWSISPPDPLALAPQQSRQSCSTVVRRVLTITYGRTKPRSK
jgi:hypothetical protein